VTTYSNLPVLAMRGNFFFPNIRAKVEVARAVSRNAVKFAVENGGKFFMVSQIDPSKPSVSNASDLYTVGVLAEIVSVESATPEITVIIAHTIEAAKITRLDISENIIFTDIPARTTEKQKRCLRRR